MTGVSLHLLIVQHDDDTGPGLLGDIASRKGVEATVVTASDLMPTDIGDFHGLVVLGAAASVNDSAIAAWFARELALLRDAVQRARPILGICFGAQALAVALGGSVNPAERAELGWVTVETVDPEVVSAGPWLAWHVDAITPPPGAAIIATNDFGVQAFSCGPHLGVQFHPEATMLAVAQWVDNDPDTMRASGAGRADLLSRTAEEEGSAGSLDRAERLMNHYLASVASAAVGPGTVGA